MHQIAVFKSIPFRLSVAALLEELQKNVNNESCRKYPLQDFTKVLLLSTASLRRCKAKSNRMLQTAFLNSILTDHSSVESKSVQTG